MDQIIIPNDIFFDSLLSELSESGSVMFRVKGWSMFPFFRNEKDAALIRPFDGSLKRSDVALYKFNGRWILHRCVGTVPLESASRGSLDGFSIGKEGFAAASIGKEGFAAASTGKEGFAAASETRGERVYVFRGDGNPRGWEWAAPENVYAVVEKKIAPSGKEWSCDSFSWRLCSMLWPRTYFFRRLFIAVLRRL